MPNPIVKRIYSPGWEKLTEEDQKINREKLRALCTKDTEKAISEVRTLKELEFGVEKEINLKNIGVRVELEKR